MKKYDEFINEEFFGFGKSIKWSKIPNENSIHIYINDDKWELTDNIFKNLNDAANMFHKIRKHIKGIKDYNIDNITEYLTKLFKHGKVEYIN